MRLFGVFAILSVLSFSTARADLKCVADLPANNPWGLPVAWDIDLNTENNTAHVGYSGGPRDGVDAELVVPNVLPTEEYAASFDILHFGYKVNDQDLRLLLAFKDEDFKKGEVRFLAKVNRFKVGSRLLDVATAYCKKTR